MQKKIIVLSSAAALSSFRGHSYNYHRAVRDSLSQVSLEYKVLIPQNNPIVNKEDLWEESLQVPTKLVGDIPSKLLRFYTYTYYALCITRSWVLFFRKFSKNTDVVVFYETGGNFLDETLISLALKIFGKKPYALWYLIRGLPDTKKFLYLLKTSIFFAEFFSGRGRLKLCTDTVPLGEYLSIALKRNVISLPIPHACNQSSAHKAQKKIGMDEIRIWGLSCIGENKGEQYLANLLKNIHQTSSAKILVRSIFLEKNKIQSKPFIEQISVELDAHEFKFLLESCKVALLPYSGGGNNAYKLSSSGIFVDAVSAGLLPLVTKGTWMEFEVNRFNLSELVVDWSLYDNFSRLSGLIEALISSQNTIRKLDNMRHSYCAMHSPNGFLEALFQNKFLTLSDFPKSKNSMGKF